MLLLVEVVAKRLLEAKGGNVRASAPPVSGYIAYLCVYLFPSLNSLQNTLIRIEETWISPSGDFVVSFRSFSNCDHIQPENTDFPNDENPLFSFVLLFFLE